MLPPPPFEENEGEIWESYERRFLEPFLHALKVPQKTAGIVLKCLGEIPRKFLEEKPTEERDTWKKCSLILSERWSQENREIVTATQVEELTKKQSVKAYKEARKRCSMCGKSPTEETEIKLEKLKREQYQELLEVVEKAAELCDEVFETQVTAERKKTLHKHIEVLIDAAWSILNGYVFEWNLEDCCLLEPTGCNQFGNRRLLFDWTVEDRMKKNKMA